MERSFNKGSTRWKKCEIPAYLRDCITHLLILDMGHHNRIRILPFRPVSLWREDSLLSGVKGLDHPSSWTARQKRIDEADSWHGWLTWWLCVYLQYLAVGEGRRVDPFCPALSMWIKLGSCLCIEEYKNIWCTIGHSGAAKVERVDIHLHCTVWDHDDHFYPLHFLRFPAFGGQLYHHLLPATPTIAIDCRLATMLQRASLLHFL